MPCERRRCERAAARRMRRATLPRRRQRPREVPTRRPQIGSGVANAAPEARHESRRLQERQVLRCFGSCVPEHIVKRVGGCHSVHRDHRRQSQHQFRGGGEQTLPYRVGGHTVFQELDHRPAASSSETSRSVPRSSLRAKRPCFQVFGISPSIAWNAKFDRKAGREWQDSGRCRDSGALRRGSEAREARIRVSTIGRRRNTFCTRWPVTDLTRSRAVSEEQRESGEIDNSRRQSQRYKSLNRGRGRESFRGGGEQTLPYRVGGQAVFRALRSSTTAGVAR